MFFVFWCAVVSDDDKTKVAVIRPQGHSVHCASTCVCKVQLMPLLCCFHVPKRNIKAFLVFST